MTMHNRIWIATCSCLVLLSGCSSANKPTDQNFIHALNTYYAEHSDCLFPDGRRFPYEVDSGPASKSEKARMDALTQAGLLKRLEDRTLHVDSYSITPFGARYASRFCYGRREVTSIDSFTPPAPSHGLTETTVTYRYTLQDVPVWARTAALARAFPALRKSLGPNPAAQETLATAGAGWQVPQ